MLCDSIRILEGGKVVNLTIDSGTVDPNNSSTGELFYRTDLNALRVYDGTSWVSVTGGGDVTLNTAQSFTAAKATTPVTLELSGQPDENGRQVDLNCNLSNAFLITQTDDISGFNVTNARDGQTILIAIKQDDVGGHDINWPENFRFMTDTDFRNDANKITLISAIYYANLGGGTWLASLMPEAD